LPTEEVAVPVVEVHNLVKTYGKFHAVDGVSFSIDAGELFALLGPNGAGKTTTVEILEGHRQSTSGTVSVLGFDPDNGGRDYRERIGIVLQDTALEPDLKVHEVIDLYGQMYPNRMETSELVGIVGLDAKADAKIKTLSGGQRRRLELALGIVGQPDVIFLDEPTTGFDPSARRQAWAVIDNLKSLGRTIVLTTHYMDEAQNLADRVAVISGGKIIDSGTPDSLGGREDDATMIRFRVQGDVDLTTLPAPSDQVAVGDDGYVEVPTRDTTAVVHAITGCSLDRDVELSGLTVTRPSLEDVYLGLTEAGDS
jgi:ABC-2 type transport system ATP-binding protein